MKAKNASLSHIIRAVSFHCRDFGDEKGMEDEICKTKSIGFTGSIMYARQHSSLLQINPTCFVMVYAIYNSQ